MCIVLLYCAVDVSTAVHIASGHTQSLHFKDSTPLVCYADRVESHFDSNKKSRAREGGRGVFWVLNNLKREKT